MSAGQVTDVFYDSGRRAWVVQYDNRTDRQEHFATSELATARAKAQGWHPGHEADQ